LIVEADGSIHDKPEIVEKDKKRQAEIESWGYTVIRFRNEEIIKDIASVLKRIEEKVEHLKQK
jgi:imidazole glycerol-phosphate synthase subunit HisF